MSRKRTIRRHYEGRINSGRPNYAIHDWASIHSQEARFMALIQNVDLQGRKLLDVGCGLGDLWTLLKARQVQADYTGVDISRKMIKTARARHADGQFVFADIFTVAPEKTFGRQAFDVVFCSGAFNLNLGNKDEFLPAAVARMMELSRRCVVFNLLHVRASDLPEKYAYYEPAEALAAIQSPGWEFRVLDDYLPNDFTVICERKHLPAS